MGKGKKIHVLMASYKYFSFHACNLRIVESSAKFRIFQM